MAEWLHNVLPGLYAGIRHSNHSSLKQQNFYFLKTKIILFIYLLWTKPIGDLITQFIKQIIHPHIYLESEFSMFLIIS